MKNKDCKHEWVNRELTINGLSRAARKCVKCPLWQVDLEIEGLTSRILPNMGFDDQTTF